MSPFSWFDAPPTIKDMLHMAVLNWEDRDLSSRSVIKALDESGNNLDVLVASYRFFFYRQDYSMALQLALKIMETVRSRRNLPEGREELYPCLLEGIEDSEIRLFINAYTAYAYILARMGNMKKAKEILCFLKEIDQKGEFGVSVLLGIMEKEDDDTL